MSFEGQESRLDYFPCRYGESKTVFRGPKVSLTRPYVATVGGCEVYGRYVEDPFAEQLADRIGRDVVNLGVANGGLDVFVRDPAILEVVGGAETLVVQAMGAHNLSNRHYMVHPRRNDRFLGQSEKMERLFSEVDFSDFTFTRHMLATLQREYPDRFPTLREELETAWVARMTELLSASNGRRILLWIERSDDRGLGSEPLFVRSEMVERLGSLVDRLVRCDITDCFEDGRLDEMTFPETERAAAERVLPPAAHQRVADALQPALQNDMGPRHEDRRSP